VSSPGLVLVTGASGRLGSKLLGVLGERGWRRRALVHRHVAGPAEEEAGGDLQDPHSLSEATASASAVVHLAALTHRRSPARYDEINARGTENLLAAAEASGVTRFLFVSTRAISEQAGRYSQSKRRAEEAVRASGLDWTIVRLPEVYGAGSPEGVDRMIDLARRGATIPLVGRGDDLLCPAHIDDVVEACARALEAPEAVKRTYTLAGPCMTMREFASIAANAFGRQPRILHVPVPAVAVLARAGRLLPIGVYPDQLARLRAPKPPASPEAEAHLAFRPRSLREGLLQVSA
jgi:nucleoside-diphosphate-sugar epimerase